jgi:hypothetical protein
MEEIPRISPVEFDPERPRTADLPVRKKLRKLEPPEIDTDDEAFHLLPEPIIGSEESGGEAHLDIEA